MPAAVIAGAPDYWRVDAAAARHHKAAAALAAVAGALRRSRPLGGREDSFLGLYRHSRRLPVPAFSAAFTDPAAYWWAHLAYELTGAVLRDAPVSAHARAYLAAHPRADLAAALAAHLDLYARFALAAAWLAGRDLRLPAPVRLTLPCALPGTRLVLTGGGTLEVTGLRNGALALAGGGHLPLAPAAAVDSAVVQQCPAARVGRHEVLLNPHALTLPGLDFTAALAGLDLDAHAREVPLVEAALALAVRHYPPLPGLLRAYLRVLALKPLHSGDYSNLSHSDLPGACVLALVRNPWELADTLIHELHHNRLFALDEYGPWFNGDVADTPAQGPWYSPWRDDLRPALGLLHATYVYVPVWRYWAAVWRGAETPDAVRVYAADRLRRFAAQLRMGLAQLAAHTDLSPAGAALARALRRRIAPMRSALTRLGVPEDPPAWTCAADGALVPERDPGGRHRTVTQSLQAHVLAHAPADQAGTVLAGAEL